MRSSFRRLAIGIMAVAAIASVFAVQNAWAGHVVRLFMLPSTELQGQAIDPSNPVFTCEPGRTLSGTFAFHAENDTTDAAPMEGALSWDDHETTWHFFADIPPADTTDFSFPIDRLETPSTAGTYYMVIGARPTREDGFVASMTSGSCTAPVWNDGNDIADQNETTLAGCLTQGWASLPVWHCDHFADKSIGITYIKLIIEDLPVGACCFGQDQWECHVTTESVCAEEGGTFHGLGTDCNSNLCDPHPVSVMFDSASTLNGQTINPDTPVLNVEPGQPIAGSMSVHVYNNTLVDVPLVGLSSWQNRETDWGNMGTAAPGHTHEMLPVGDLTAPLTPGSYYMMLASIPGPGGAYIASMTSPTCGSPVWNDGNDLADQNETTLANCVMNGYATLPQWVCDHMVNVGVGIFYVKIVVLNIPSGACCLGGQCYQTTSNLCTNDGGAYLGDGISCNPDLCGSPTKHTTWSHIRGMYK